MEFSHSLSLFSKRFGEILIKTEGGVCFVQVYTEASGVRGADSVCTDYLDLFYDADAARRSIFGG